MGPTRRVLGAAVGSGVAAAVAVPVGRPGLGWVVVAVVIVAATLSVGWRARWLAPWTPPAPARAASAAATLALAGVAAVRAAEWLVVLCLLTACASGPLAVTGRAFRGATMSVLAVPLAAFRAVPWISRALRGGRRGGWRTAVAVFGGLVVLAVFGPLLASADAAFAGLLDGLVPQADLGSVTRPIVLFGLAGGAVAGASFLLLAPPERAPERPPAGLNGLEWTVPIGVLVALFALFAGVQGAAAAGGIDLRGTTYAEYARSGFWQLLAVTVLTMGVIVGALRLAPARTPTEQRCKRGLLGALAVLTMVIVATAVSRMWLYQQAYGFTVLRLLVLTCELWLGVGFVLVLHAVVRLRTRGPARGMISAAIVALLALAVLDPERFIAEHNVTRYAESGRIDVDYLGSLSADAVPGLARLAEPMRSCVLTRMAMSAVLDADWRSWNASRAAAAPALLGVSGGDACGQPR